MMEAHLACGLSLFLASLAALWVFRALAEVPTPSFEMSSDLLEAMQEVDAMLPHTPPITPLFWTGRAALARNPDGTLDLSRLLVPDALAAEVRLRETNAEFAERVWPRCTGPGSCGYHHRKGIPCGQALNERRPPPPQPMPTRIPGPGILGA